MTHSITGAMPLQYPLLTRFDRYKQGSKVKKRPCEDMNQYWAVTNTGAVTSRAPRPAGPMQPILMLEPQRFFELTLGTGKKYYPLCLR